MQNTRITLGTLCFLALTACATTLTACATSVSVPVFKVVAEKPKLEKAPYWMTRPCPRLFQHERAKMSKKDSIAAAVKDDKLYEDCRVRHQAHVAWVAERDRKIMGLAEPAPKKTRRGKTVPKGPVGSLFSYQ